MRFGFRECECARVIDEGLIVRKIAQIEIVYSNSMSEAFNRSLKHNHLFLKELSSLQVLEKHVDFYAQQHNEVIPHFALKGATPEEVYLGQWKHLIQDSIPKEIIEAQKSRIEYHRNLKPCGICTN